MRVKPAIAIAALLLIGCTAAPAPVQTPAPMVTGTPTADAVDPSLDSDALFVISATTTSASGDAVELTMTGHASQAYDARPEIKQAYIDQCTALGGGTVMDADGTLDDASLAAFGSSLMVIDTTSTPASTPLVGGIELRLGNPFYFVVASGDGLSNPYASGCYGGYQIDSTGTVTSITNYETGDPTPDLAQWRSGRYGFSVAYGSSAVLENCVITLTQLAIDSGVGEIDGWYPDSGTESECAIGYRGE